jgi:hypothetical protein
MSTGFDPNVPRQVVKDLMSEQPNRAAWSEDLKTLLDASVVARDLSTPMKGMFLFKNTDWRYRLVRLRQGPNPDTSRYMEVKAMGGQNATTEDVEVLSGDVKANKVEIRVGVDLILMKIPRDVYDGRMKAQMLQALQMTGRASRGEFQDNSRGQVMRTSDYGGVSVADLETGESNGPVDIARMIERSSPANTSTVSPTGGK